MKIFNKLFKEKNKTTQVNFIDESEPCFYERSYPDNIREEYKIVIDVKPFTMTSEERIFSLINAVNYIIKNKIEGDIVECGVWKGGGMMAVAKQLIRLNSSSQKLYLYDTFEEGMTKPSKEDLRYDNIDALPFLENWESKNTYPSLKEVKNNMYSTGYPKDKIEFIQGDVLNTIPKFIPEKISILRLDTDWFETTKHEMNHLFPKLSLNGILIIDDYGHWKGARKAVDEYLNSNNIKIFLGRVDYTCRLGVKL